MESVFAEYLPRLVASWNPQCSAVNRSVVQQLGQQIVALEDDLCRFRINVKTDHEVKINLATKEAEIEALRDAISRLEKVLIKANQRMLDLEKQNEKLTILQHSDRQVIKQLSSKLKIKPRDLAKEICNQEWDPNDATVALEKLVLAKNYEALQRRFDESNKMHMMAIEKLNQSHHLALKEKITDVEELRKKNNDLQKSVEEKRNAAINKKFHQLEELQKNYAKAVLSKVDRVKTAKSASKDFHHHELVKIIDTMEKENLEKNKQLAETKQKMSEQLQYFKQKLKQLRQRKRREEEGLRNHVHLLEDQIRKLRIQASKSSKSNSADASDED